MKAVGIILLAIGGGALFAAALTFEWKLGALALAIAGGLLWLLNSDGNETG